MENAVEESTREKPVTKESAAAVDEPMAKTPLYNEEEVRSICEACKNKEEAWGHVVEECPQSMSLLDKMWQEEVYKKSNEDDNVYEGKRPIKLQKHVQDMLLALERPVEDPHCFHPLLPYDPQMAVGYDANPVIAIVSKRKEVILDFLDSYLKFNPTKSLKMTIRGSVNDAIRSVYSRGAALKTVFITLDLDVPDCFQLTFIREWQDKLMDHYTEGWFTPAPPTSVILSSRDLLEWYKIRCSFMHVIKTSHF